MENSSTPEKLVGALVSGLRVMRYLGSMGTPVGVSRVARDLRLNSSTCFNLLKTLVHERLVTFDEASKTYSVGLGLVEMAKGALEQASYVRMLRPHLEQVALRHRVTATLWNRIPGHRVLLVDRADVESAVRVHMSIGQRLPMYIGALGRCMAAHSGLSDAELRSLITELRWDAAPNFEEYRIEVEHARRLGYAVDRGQYVKGVTAASAPILDRAGQPIMAISAVGFSAQLDAAALKALGEDLRDRGAEISQVLSGQPAPHAAQAEARTNAAPMANA